jgi:DNA-binding transcriptional MerR regulator
MLGVNPHNLYQWSLLLPRSIRTSGYSNHLNYDDEVIRLLKYIIVLKSKGYIDHAEIKQKVHRKMYNDRRKTKQVNPQSQCKQPTVNQNIKSGISLTFEEFNLLNETIVKKEREKKELRDRIATLENSLDNLLATISDLRNQQQPQPMQHVEPEPDQVVINDTGKKWWAIKPLQKLLNGGM